MISSRSGKKGLGETQGLGETRGSLVSVNSAQVDKLIESNLRDTTYTFDSSKMPEVKTARSGRRMLAEEKEQEANAGWRSKSRQGKGLGDTRMSLGSAVSGMSDISRVSGISGWSQMGNTERAKIKIFDRKLATKMGLAPSSRRTGSHSDNNSPKTSLPMTPYAQRK